MKLDFYNGVTSVILRVLILDTSKTNGGGLTGLSSASSGLSISTLADVESSATVYSGSNIQAVSVLGTYAAPSAGKCRFSEVDSTNHKGLYEIQLADARFAVTNARSLIVTISGATNAADTHIEIQLQDTTVATRGVKVISYASGQAPLQPTVAGRTLGVTSGGQAGLDFNNINDAGSAHTLTNITVPLVTTTSALTTNNDKTGYALSAAGVQAIWDALTSALVTANSIGSLLTTNVNATISSRLASSSITLLGGAVTVGTNNDKTGYALTSGERDSIAAALLDLANSIESGLTLRQYLRGAASALLGKNVGSATSPQFNNAVADAKVRITASSDRTSLTLDLT